MKIRNKNPKHRHRRIEAHNISKLCKESPGKYPAPSSVYFGEIGTVFSIFRDLEIDMAVLRVESEIAQEDFEKSQKLQKPRTPQSPQYRSPVVKRHDDDDAW